MYMGDTPATLVLAARSGFFLSGCSSEKGTFLCMCEDLEGDSPSILELNRLPVTNTQAEHIQVTPKRRIAKRHEKPPVTAGKADALGRAAVLPRGSQSPASPWRQLQVANCDSEPRQTDGPSGRWNPHLLHLLQFPPDCLCLKGGHGTPIRSRFEYPFGQKEAPAKREVSSISRTALLEQRLQHQSLSKPDKE